MKKTAYAVMAPAGRGARWNKSSKTRSPPQTQSKTCAARRENGLEDKKEEAKSRRRKALHCGSVPVYFHQHGQPKMPASQGVAPSRPFTRAVSVRKASRHRPLVRGVAAIL
jgi:hypothetical protein